MRGTLRFISLLACALLASCAQGLDTKAEIRYATQTTDPALADAASRIPGMTLVQDATPDYWSLLLRKDMDSQRPHDLFTVIWGRELMSAQKEGELADLKRLWPRTRASRRMPSFLKSIVPSPAQGFIPSAVSMWGLFYNRRLYAELGSPKIQGMEQLASLLEAAKQKGIVPIALGASFGWPGAAWFSYLDLRLNGGKEAWQRVLADRPFDDAGGREAARTLAQWRDTGYFSPNAPRSDVQASIREVESGKALFVLMGSFTAGRLGGSPGVGFMDIPFWKGRGRPRGEIVDLLGFAIPAGSKSPEAALALVDGYLTAGGVNQAAESALLPIEFAPSSTEDRRGLQSQGLSRTMWIMPPGERIMPSQFVQDSIRAWSAFFDPKTGSSGAELVRALQALKEKAAPSASSDKAAGP
jgi:ABC-type glycerol-3-phosphate transport system substrate-binding protein